MCKTSLLTQVACLGPNDNIDTHQINSIIFCNEVQFTSLSRSFAEVSRPSFGAARHLTDGHAEVEQGAADRLHEQGGRPGCVRCRPGSALRPPGEAALMIQCYVQEPKLWQCRSGSHICICNPKVLHL